MENTYKLPQRMKSRRKELGLTLLQIAKRVGTSEATVQRWENGSIKTLRYENIVKLADALETTPAYLMGWEYEETIKDYNKVLDRLLERRQTLRKFIDEAPEEVLDVIEMLLTLPPERFQALANLAGFLGQDKRS